MITQPGPLDAGRQPVTVRSLLVDTVRAHPERPAITFYRPPTRTGRHRGAGWQTLTWHEFAHVLLDVLDWIEQDLAGARTVAILAETDARYPLVELALGLSGRAVQPLYVTSTDEELHRALQITGADALLVGRSQRERVDAGRVGAGRPVVDLDSLVRLPGDAGTPPTTLAADVEPFDTAAVRVRLAALAARPAGAALLYLQSTGTTGPARVIEVSEAAMTASILAVRDQTTVAFPRFLSFLPTAHISERLVTLYVSVALAGHTWYGGGLETLAADLVACRPTVLLAPPLVYDAIRQQALATAAASAPGRRLVAEVRRTADGALASGRTMSTRRRAGARIFGWQLRRQAGLGRVQDAFVGTAPASADLMAWWEAVGLPLRDVYGQTEVAGATSISSRRGAPYGAVGRPLHGVEATLDDGGELLVRSPSAFTRYVADEAATARTMPDGWLRTGDRAVIRDDGEIVLVGRVQSLVTASDGTVVDTGVLAARIAAEFGPADVVLAPAAGDIGRNLYLAAHPAGQDEHTLRESAWLDPAADGDARWDRLATLLAEADPHAVIRGMALFDGAFTLSTGEVGPTGKTRGWRIHQLRHRNLRPRDAIATPTAPEPDLTPATPDADHGA
ncbi:AMP-binding protein [Frankia sp. AiPs1]|uniref:AMP-binding protein n=1 Tax=Frankia sp. AiPa1 TaxID=573492 RepID=UPI00202B7B8B|nr:AMP-binding protein [Frankia sp. AiPa1]MCL9760302.1 AMP-binding protein [Frankia sp. AiPa1]